MGNAGFCGSKHSSTVKPTENQESATMFCDICQAKFTLFNRKVSQIAIFVAKSVAKLSCPKKIGLFWRFLISGYLDTILVPDVSDSKTKSGNGLSEIDILQQI